MKRKQWEKGGQMKVKISDWIADFLVQHGIRHNFTVTGGGAIHLNMSFACKAGLTSIYMQHEQAAAMAAEGYYRATNELPVVCCTTGPGGTNTLTGVLGAWLDSIPMLVISGQVRYAVTARAAGVPVRAAGDQEFDIAPMAAHMTKYAVMVTEPDRIVYHMQKALYLATHGRPGPVWLDVPLDIQGGFFDPAVAEGFSPDELDEAEKAPDVTDSQIQAVIAKIRQARRPVFYVGNAIHTAGCVQLMQKVARKLNIPVVTAWNATDLMPHQAELFAGIPGLLGDRPGNWAVQNADCILSAGCRLGCRQAGYNVSSWARETFVIMVDIDKAELQKPSIHVEMPVQADVSKFLTRLEAAVAEPLHLHKEWLSVCAEWKQKYPVVQKKHYEAAGAVNAYCFLDTVSRKAPQGQYFVLGNGTVEACLHAIHIKEGTRLICNSGAASMGYGLPAAIGCCIAIGKKEVICLTGDGSIQMNLQELQTIVHHRLPVKIFVLNNGGYHSIRQTQTSLFPDCPKAGIGPESGDLSFPDLKKIAQAYAIPYFQIMENGDVAAAVDGMIRHNGYAMCEVFADTAQKFEPKSATRRLEDGTLVSPPLEDLEPFLPREDLEKIMIIPMWKEKQIKGDTK